MTHPLEIAAVFQDEIERLRPESIRDAFSPYCTAQRALIESYEHMIKGLEGLDFAHHDARMGDDL